MAYLDDNGLLYLWSKIKTLLANKVDKVSGKQLSTNDYTTVEKNKLSGIADNATRVIVEQDLVNQSSNPLAGKVVQEMLGNVTNGIQQLADNKVDKEISKGLSTNDYTTAEKTKLAGLNNFVHPTTDGNKHVPATGTTNNGKALIAGATAGAFSWQTLTKSMVGLGSVDNTSDLNKPVSSAVHNELNNKVDLFTDLDINSSLERSRGMNIIDGVVANNASDTMLLFNAGPFEAAFCANGAQKVRYREYDGNRNPVWTGWVTNNIFSDVLLTKLNGIETNANNYVHPSTHPATIITPDATHRFVTDEEKTGWNNHTSSKGNPHSVTKAQIGLNNVDNTSDLNKPISSAMQIALDNKAGTGTVTTSRPGLMSVSDKVKLDAFGNASTYALKADIVGMYKYKGSVADASKLPTTGQVTGDVYNIVSPSVYGAAGANVAWDGSKWDSLGEIFTITSITNAQIDTICA